MNLSVRFRFIFTLLFLLLLPCSALLAAESAVAAPTQHQIKILFISSYEKQYTVQTQLESGLAQGLKSNQRQYEIFYEFMYASRNRDKGFHDIYVNYLDKKFSGIPLDYIVAWADDAGTFLNEHPGLFPAAKRIYLQKPDQLDLVPQNLHAIIGIRTDFKKSVSAMLALQQPEKLLVIGSTENSVARTRYQQITQALKELAPAIDIEYIVDEPLDQVESRLSNANEASVAAFFVLMFSDGKGVDLSPYDVAAQLAQVSRIPIYTYLENIVGSGVVGGYVISQTAQGRQLAELLLDTNSSGQTVEMTPMHYVFDWAAVERWQVDQSNIPADAVIINRPPKLLREYYPYIVAGIIFCGIQMVLIIYLVVNHNRRRRAEEELKKHRDQLEDLVTERTGELVESHRELAEKEDRFRSLSDAAVEGIAFVADGKVIEANKSMADMLLYTTAEIIGKDVTEFVDPAQRDLVINNIRTNYRFPYETLLVDKNGDSFPVSIHGRTFTYRCQRVRIAAIRDLRELKKAQEEIQTLQGILPICASCKKIRDDSGYWNRIEDYIQKHSTALFSHGLCTDCAEELYGDQPWFKEISEEDLKNS